MQDSRSLDIKRIHEYLVSLSPESQRRFAPHGYGADEIRAFYQDPLNIAFAVKHQDSLVGYAVLRMACLQSDAERLKSYGFTLDERIDASFAPSVADAWQGRGAAAMMMDRMLAYAKEHGKRRIFLWGGVQADNARAFSFYRKYGFTELGRFHHNGENIDMVKLL